jgi:hypothetical protein
MKLRNRIFMLAAAVLCPSAVLAHGDHQHIGGTLALLEHFAAHVDYKVMVLLAVVGVIVWLKMPDA